MVVDDAKRTAVTSRTLVNKDRTTMLNKGLVDVDASGFRDAIICLIHGKFVGIAWHVSKAFPFDARYYKLILQRQSHWTLTDAQYL